MALNSRPQTRPFWIPLNSNLKIRALKFLLSSALLLSFAIAPTALAGYKPKNPSRPSGSTGTTGVRTGSYGEATKGMITALAPLGHTGQTATTRPTFAWYVPDVQSYTIEFALFRYENNDKFTPLQTSRLESKKGIMQYSLPKEQANLAVGQTYLWQVALLCSPSDPSKDQLVRAAIEITAMPVLLQLALTKTSDRLQRAKLYAESGFWYDALAEALAATQTKPFTIALLEDLVKLEAAETSDKAKQQRDRLQQVLETERQ